MKNKRNFLIIALLAASNFLFAQHDIIIEISAPNTLASDIKLQHNLSVINYYKGGTLTIKDISDNNDASIIIDSPISVFSNTKIIADNANNEYGIIFKGTKKEGQEYRPLGNPIFVASNVNNVQFENLKFDGAPIINSNLVYNHAVSIAITNSSNITITNCFVDNAVRRGFTLYQCENVSINKSKVLLQFYDNYPLERMHGAAGIWMYKTKESVIENCEVWAPTYYKNDFTLGGGICWRDPRVGTVGNITPTAELISSYDGENNVFQNNYVHDGNTTAFYICGSNAEEEVVGRGNGEIIQNNTIINFGQLSLDVANQDNIQIIGNIVKNSDLPSLGYADCHNGLIKDNVFMGSCQDISAENNHSGVMFLLWGSSNNTIQNNDIHSSCLESNAKYGLIFSGIDRMGVDAKVSGNNIIDNKVSKGLVDFYGGEDLAFNTVTPNTETEAIISASSTELILDEGTVGTIYLTWTSSCDNSDIAVWLKTDIADREEQLFSSGLPCSEGVEFSWISPDIEYEFSIWKVSGNSINDRIEKLSSVMVNGLLKETLNSEISNINKDGSFKIFPNPSSNIITIEYPKNDEINSKQLTIYSTTGAIVYKSELSSYDKKITIDVSSLNKGLYLVKTVFNNEGQVVRKLLVK